MDVSKYPAFQGVLLPEKPGVQNLSTILPIYHKMLVEIMACIADRYESDPEYHYINTKLDIISGENFSDEDPLGRKNSIYGLIQGRGLEALAGHCRWFELHPEVEGATSLVPRLRKMMEEVIQSMLKVRERNGGHVPFLHTPEGKPLEVDKEGNIRILPYIDSSASYNMNDMFCSKGMYAAAKYLQDKVLEAQMLRYSKDVFASIWADFYREQSQSGPPKRARGSNMLHLGTTMLLAKTGDPDAADMGLRLLNFIVERHINNSRYDYLRPYDYWEYAEEDGRPLVDDNGQILQDPGHSLECVGLALAFYQALRENDGATTQQLNELDDIAKTLLKVMKQSFSNGFNTVAQGIYKSFDLIKREPINSDMPWWNLPETMRAAALGYEIAKEEKDKEACLEIIAKSSNAFISKYVQPDRWYMAYQTRAADGRVVRVIPLTADADPGYHTGLSVIWMLEALDRIVSN